ncbi:MAG: methyltransferase domain-containing protein [Dehalococcoidia bacterium]|nr:methyltransferase domain-containing protein [Dehalococcoidia bacterium]
MASTWNPNQYNRFQDERSKPFHDLLALVQPIPGGRAIDLGCGTGELTKVMHERVQARATIGLDNSETMLDKSAAFAGRGLTFKLGTILRFAPRTPFDLIFSNAALQWVDDHELLFERLAAGLAAGGQLAVQMPLNHDHASHVVADAVAGEEPFATALKGYVRRVPVETPEWYAEKLDALGFAEMNVRMQVYPQHLGGPEDVVEWVKGAYLTDYQSRMPAELFPAYLARYSERLLAVLADRRPYFYPYKRLLLWGRK